jgi:arylsulfatase A-like enzyme
VIFSSDNGPVYDDGYMDGTVVRTSTKEVDQGHDGSGPFRGGKYQIYEGGTRVPFIVRWPGHVEPGTSDALVNQIDFLASFASFFDQTLQPKDARDSRDTMDVLLGKSDESLPFMIEEAGRLALREGNWKYIQTRNGPGELFNLSTDIGEQDNVIESNAERGKRMRQTLDTIAKSNEGTRAFNPSAASNQVPTG